MRQWLPWAVLAVLALLIAVAPWRKPDPKHEFIIYMLQNATAGEWAPTGLFTSAQERNKTSEHGTAAGRDHGTGSADV